MPWKHAFLSFFLFTDHCLTSTPRPDKWQTLKTCLIPNESTLTGCGVCGSVDGVRATGDKNVSSRLWSVFVLVEAHAMVNGWLLAPGRWL